MIEYLCSGRKGVKSNVEGVRGICLEGIVRKIPPGGGRRGVCMRELSRMELSGIKLYGDELMNFSSIVVATVMRFWRRGSLRPTQLGRTVPNLCIV